VGGLVQLGEEAFKALGRRHVEQLSASLPTARALSRPEGMASSPRGPNKRDPPRPSREGIKDRTEVSGGLHLILDNGSTHAPKRLPAWITTLDLPFPVHLHWLPVNASWLDQIEIVFSELQRKALTPNNFDSTAHVCQRIRAFFAERNRRAQPIRWTYTTQKLVAKVRRQQRLAATG
jgi:DDE superfamily endonuclease